MVTNGLPPGQFPQAGSEHAESIAAEILQGLLQTKMPVPYSHSHEPDGSITLNWTVADISASLNISPEGFLEYKTEEILRDKYGDRIGVENASGFLSDPGAVDLLMMTILRPLSKEA